MQGTFERLVVPVGGSAAESRALDILPALLPADGGMVTFLYVVEVAQAMPLDAELPIEVEAGERVLRNAEQIARRALPSRAAQIQTELLQARAVGPAIVDEAIERNADAILLSATVYRRHGKLTLGDAANHVLLHATCDVVVIRTPNRSLTPEGASPP